MIASANKYRLGGYPVNMSTEDAVQWNMREPTPEMFDHVTVEIDGRAVTLERATDEELEPVAAAAILDAYVVAENGERVDEEYGFTVGGLLYSRKDGEPVHLTSGELKAIMAAVMTAMDAVRGRVPKSAAVSVEKLIAKIEDAADLDFHKTKSWI
jgi:hypothetical protein